MKQHWRALGVKVAIAAFVGVSLRFAAEFLLGHPMRSWELRTPQLETTHGDETSGKAKRSETARPTRQRVRPSLEIDDAGGGSTGPAPEAVRREARPDAGTALEEDPFPPGLSPGVAELRAVARKEGVPELFERVFARQQGRPVGFSMRESIELGASFLEFPGMQEDAAAAIARLSRRNVDVIPTRRMAAHMAGTQLVAILIDGEIEVVYGSDLGLPNVSPELQARAFARLSERRWDDLTDAQRQRVIERTMKFFDEFEIAKREFWTLVAEKAGAHYDSVPDIVCLVVRGGKARVLRSGTDAEVDLLLNELSTDRRRYRARLLDALR